MIPFGPDWAVITDVNIGLLFVLAVSSVGVLALILAGWSSNSKYSLLGALAFERADGFLRSGDGPVADRRADVCAHAFALRHRQRASSATRSGIFVYQPLGFLIFLVSGIAENNRAPFDLPEAESELVAGFHTEYSGFRWSLFFMAEYAAMVVVSAVAVTVYLGGWYFPFVYRLTEAKGYHNLYVIVSLLVFLVKLSVILYLYFWLRWTLPRFRYDQLMDIGWKWLIPSALINIALSALAIFVVQALDGWRGIKTIRIAHRRTGSDRHRQGVMIVMGLLGLGITGLLLARINWRSRDFNLKSQRRNIKLVNLPQGKPAVPAVARGE